MNRRALAFGIAAAAFGLNLVVEHALMKVGTGFAIIPGLADFVPTFNHGVSFSLFTQTTASGHLLLMAVLTVISAAVAVMAWRATTSLSAAAFGLVLGGALGNLADRWVYNGGVFDFLWLHLGRTSLFICNGADIFISAGVVLLMIDGYLAKPRST